MPLNDYLNMVRHIGTQLFELENQDVRWDSTYASYNFRNYTLKYRSSHTDVVEISGYTVTNPLIVDLQWVTTGGWRRLNLTSSTLSLLSLMAIAKVRILTRTRGWFYAAMDFVIKLSKRWWQLRQRIWTWHQYIPSHKPLLISSLEKF